MSRSGKPRKRYVKEEGAAYFDDETVGEIYYWWNRAGGDPFMVTLRHLEPLVPAFRPEHCDPRLPLPAALRAND